MMGGGGRRAPAAGELPPGRQAQDGLTRGRPDSSLSYRKTTLPNGLRVLTAPMPHTHSVSISIYVGAGSRYETPPEAGLSHFVEHLCFKGTERRPTAREISEVIDGVGGILNAGTDRELTVYYCKVALPHLELALDVLVDMLRNPLFVPEEVDQFIERHRPQPVSEAAQVGEGTEEEE